MKYLGCICDVSVRHRIRSEEEKELEWVDLSEGVKRCMLSWLVEIVHKPGIFGTGEMCYGFAVVWN